MSGGGGSSSGGNGRGGEASPCDQLSFEANLASPVEDVVQRLRLRAELDVELRSDRVVVARFEGDEAGSIVTRLPDLRRCLSAGYTFRARVLSMDDGIVHVEVGPG